MHVVLLCSVERGDRKSGTEGQRERARAGERKGEKEEERGGGRGGGGR
jgi:hypothetical protein